MIFSEGKICQIGRSQSPIFIDLSQTTYVPHHSLIFSISYRQTTTFQVSNFQNQTISIKPILRPSTALLVKGGPLSGVFTFKSVHLHWPQSEHKFFKKNYTAEAHFIHKNLITNETAVFAYFFTLVNSQSQQNNNPINNWDFLLQKFINNNNKDTNITIKDGLISLMEGDIDRFVQYFGSLSTSRCTEGISWILFPSAIELRDTHLDYLRRNIVTINYRDIQPLNDRIIRRSFPSTLWMT